MNMVLWSLFLIAGGASASPSMNGIELGQYGDFTKEWRLVTVRHRKDTGEMRFTYANPLAWKALQARAAYPDGAVFAKIGYKTGSDPAFDSSIVPSGARRYQYMVRDSKRYKDTGGWGYAVFKADGELFQDEDVPTQTLSCHACHEIVPERHYVFSSPIEFAPFAKDVDPIPSRGVSWTELPPKSWKKVLAAALPRGQRQLQIIDGKVRSYFFGGTLDEVTPLLLNRLKLKPSIAAGFVSLDQETFKLAWMEAGKECSEGQMSFRVVERRRDWPDSLKTPRTSRICY